MQKRNLLEAKRLAELSLKFKPDQKSVLIDLASAEVVLKETENAIKHAEYILRLFPGTPGGHLTLAMACLDKNDSECALKHSETAMNLTNGHFFYTSIYAASLEKAGKTQQAETALRKAYPENLPTYEDLDVWYITETSRSLILKIVGRFKDKGKVG